MTSRLYIEGGAQGPNSKESQIRCRQGFRKLLERCGFGGRLPRLTACGGRTEAFEDFKIGHSIRATGDFVAMLIDSETPLRDLEAAWQHLSLHDHWERPAGVEEKQVLFMTTCMETWIIADHDALQKHYGGRLQTSALPPLVNIEGRDRHEIQDALMHATRNCTNTYTKGKRSFEILAKLSPDVLEQLLPSFDRSRRILNDNL